MTAVVRGIDVLHARAPNHCHPHDTVWGAIAMKMILILIADGNGYTDEISWW